MEKAITISFVGDTALKARLEEVAVAQRGRSVSSIIREVLEDWLAATNTRQAVDPRQAALPLAVEGVGK